MDLITFTAVVLVASLHSLSVKGQSLVSCAQTVCAGDRSCRIIQRCWSGDCQTGTGCVDPSKLPLDRTDFKCPYDDPILRSLDGGALVEIKCGSSNPLNTCPEGTECIEPAGVCCTGATKNTGQCPATRENYFQTNGGCRTFCRHDQECPGYKRCCATGIGCNHCMDPVPALTCETKACDAGFHCLMSGGNCTSYPCLAEPVCIADKIGDCPVLPGMSICEHVCLVDTHCPGDQKCCSAGACHVCVSPALYTTTSLPPADVGGPGSVSSSTSASSTPLFGFASLGSMDASNNIITPAAGPNPPAVPMFDMMSGVQPTNSGPVQMMAPTLGGMGSVQTSPTMLLDQQPSSSPQISTSGLDSLGGDPQGPISVAAVHSGGLTGMNLFGPPPQPSGPSPGFFSGPRSPRWLQTSRTSTLSLSPRSGLHATLCAS
ncbi:uncharacterized protein LOC112566621 isoform X2 [Pomacea canaliculata]|uniref:uncharacterized protein LOC112566621 isoform X2 n=1 Tax=Pomacea canaliculata TaxID=400727 RepID=UPI000D73659B|nr:uncharacterized protein LOC112566621 isoform X2 [Pomacea canaliculata]